MTARTLSFVLLPALLLAACDPRLNSPSNLAPREIQTLAGVWEGHGTLRLGNRDCPSAYLWNLRVGGGNVDGEIVDPETPRAPASRFTTFLDYDGTLRALARPGGRDTAISGTFHRDSFSGEAKSQQCTYVLRLRRSAAGT